MSGWIKLHRKILESQVWTSEPFSRGQAWVDLLLLANHEYGFFYLRDHKIEVQRGQVGWSHLRLSKRWKWSRTKVKRFIKDLENEQQVKQQQSHSTSVITILNYDEYQEKEQQKDNRNATGMQQKDTNKKNRRIIKKNKEGIYISPEDFYKAQIDDNKGKSLILQYELAAKFIMDQDTLPLMEIQLSYSSFATCYNKAKGYGYKLSDYLKRMENWKDGGKDVSKKNKSISQTLHNWMDNDAKRSGKI